MRALHVPAAGQPPVVAEIPAPDVADGQVLVRVRVAGLNAIDNAIAAGMLVPMMPHEYPLVLGRDAAGVVEAVGAGVDHVTVGDEVFGHVLLAPPLRAGTLAELAVLPGEAVALKPPGLGFASAAALPLAGAAAVAAIEAIDPSPGETVLVNGASGGVGSYAVQLLAARGVTVVATGAPADADRLRARGAAVVVDFTADAVAEQVRASYPGGVDALVNLAGFTAADVPLGALRPGGRVATTTGAPDAAAAEAAGVSSASVMAHPVRQVIEPLADQAASGALAVDVTTTLSLDEATGGLSTIASGQAHGKIVVAIG
jgi:NADPH:quinone reductase-like Zn-dependent oxidoreductase